jgi:hypothetical protein
MERKKVMKKQRRKQRIGLSGEVILVAKIRVGV